MDAVTIKPLKEIISNFVLIDTRQPNTAAAINDGDLNRPDLVEIQKEYYDTKQLEAYEFDEQTIAITGPSIQGARLAIMSGTESATIVGSMLVRFAAISVLMNRQTGIHNKLLVTELGEKTSIRSVVAMSKNFAISGTHPDPDVTLIYITYTPTQKSGAYLDFIP